MREVDLIFPALFWPGITIAFYMMAKRIHRRWSFWFTAPLMLAPLFVLAVALVLHQSYGGYIRHTHWLLSLLGPATVAFAIPIWERRALIRRYWPILIAGVVVGSTTAVLSAWLFSSLFGLSRIMRLSLLPRSMSTPFAMTVSGDIGGVPDLTAIFVVLTGVFGAAIGELILNVLPLKSVIARGALFGAGAHGAGVAKATQIGAEEGAVAGVVMVLVGVFNVLIAPLVAHFVR
jgi:predicted murein hydrolase (TIGR00659 family)